MVVAFIDDLMDRSRLDGTDLDVRFAREPADAAGADVVAVDVVGFGRALPEIRRAAPSARLVAFGPHVDVDALRRAERDGADRAVPRSRFFTDTRAILAGT